MRPVRFVALSEDGPAFVLADEVGRLLALPIDERIAPALRPSRGASLGDVDVEQDRTARHLVGRQGAVRARRAPDANPRPGPGGAAGRGAGGAAAAGERRGRPRAGQAPRADAPAGPAHPSRAVPP